MADSRKTIVVYDYNTHGHHPSYLALMTMLLLRLDCDVWLMCGNQETVLQSLTLTDDEQHLRSRITCFPVQAPRVARGVVLRNLRMGLESWQNAARDVARACERTGKQPDFTFFLSASDFSRGLIRKEQVDRIYPRPWGALMIHLILPFLHHPQGLLNRLLMALQYHRPKYYQSLDIYNSGHCRFFLTLQEDCLTYLQQIMPGKAHVFPDISSEQYRTDLPVFDDIKAKANGRKIITLVGNQNARKGTFMLLDLARRCGDRDWFFLFAGKDDYVRGRKSEQSLVAQIQADKERYENCYLFIDKIDERVFNGLFVISDLIFVMYKDFPYSSNILTKAALFGKPVISSPHLVGARTKEFSLGKEVAFGDIDGCLAAIAEVFAGAMPHANFEGFYARNSLQSASRLLRQLILSPQADTGITD